MEPLELLRAMMTIRAFEETLAARPDRGFQLFSSGQEAVSVGVCAVLQDGDQLLSGGRSIAPALARGLDPALVLAELLGKSAGPCGGKGGRGHLAQPAAGFFGAHAVVGGNLSIAAGVALAAQVRGLPIVVACIFGDGACGSGALHETLNIAAIWKLPLLFVCDDNGYSVSTPRSAVLAPKHLADLAKPFGIPAATVDGMNVLAVRDAAAVFAARIRAGDGPAFLECTSQRFSSHSTGTRETRSAAEMETILELCPIRTLAARLERDGMLNAQVRVEIESGVAQTIAEAVRFAEAAPFPDAATATADVV